jgi:hypothetical protein
MYMSMFQTVVTRFLISLAVLFPPLSSEAQVRPGEPNFNYRFYVPKGWREKDTLMQDLKFRLVRGPLGSEKDNPFVNVLINYMDGADVNDFASRNVKYLVSNMSGIQASMRGKLSGALYDIRWFTYIKEQGGVRREMINYIIPVRGFAYMMTCGVSEGAMGRYRAIFDKMAKSFKA